MNTTYDTRLVNLELGTHVDYYHISTIVYAYNNITFRYRNSL